MDKATVALAATEDNAAAIAKLQKTVGKIGCRAVNGVVEGTFSKLGEVTSDGKVVVIAVVPAGGASLIYFNGELLRKDKTPLFTILPAGTGELTVQPPVAGVYAIILGE